MADPIDEASTQFVVDEVITAVKESIEQTIGDQVYQQKMINKWTNTVIEECLTKLCNMAKPFKYVVTCAIMQKVGAGFHGASSCYWDNATDGNCTVRWENKTMYVIITVFGCAI